MPMPCTSPGWRQLQHRRAWGGAAAGLNPSRVAPASDRGRCGKMSEGTALGKSFVTPVFSKDVLHCDYQVPLALSREFAVALPLLMRRMRMLLDVRDLERETSISRYTWRSWLKVGKLPHVRLGRRVRVTVEDLAAFLAANRRLGPSTAPPLPSDGHHAEGAPAPRAPPPSRPPRPRSSPAG